MPWVIWYYLYNLKNLKNTHSRVLRLVNLNPATLLKVTLLHGCFSPVLNCVNDIKSRRVSHLFMKESCNFDTLTCYTNYEINLKAK